MNAYHSIIAESILVVGGESRYEKDTVELLSLTPGTESRILGKFPKKIYSAVGITLGESEIQSFWMFYNQSSLIINYQLPC